MRLNAVYPSLYFWFQLGSALLVRGQMSTWMNLKQWILWQGFIASNIFFAYTDFVFAESWDRLPHLRPHRHVHPAQRSRVARPDTAAPLFAGELTGVVQGEVVVATRSLDPPAGGHRRRQSLRLGRQMSTWMNLKQWILWQSFIASNIFFLHIRILFSQSHRQSTAPATSSSRASSATEPSGATRYCGTSLRRWADWCDAGRGGGGNSYKVLRSSSRDHGWSFLFSWWGGCPTNFGFCHTNFMACHTIIL